MNSHIENLNMINNKIFELIYLILPSVSFYVVFKNFYFFHDKWCSQNSRYNLLLFEICDQSQNTIFFTGWISLILLLIHKNLYFLIFV